MSGYKRAKVMPHVRVGVGDVVEFRHTPIFPLGERKELEIFQAIVSEVKPSYYSPKNPTTGKRTQSPPTVYYTRLDNGEKGMMGANWVNRVVQRYAGPSRGPQNGFSKYRNLAHYVQTNEKGVWCGTLDELVLRVLAYLPLQLNGELMNDYMLDLFYAKQKAGFLRWAGDEIGSIYVRAKPFKKWVTRNAYRLCATIQELRENATYLEEQFEEYMEEDAQTSWEEYLDTVPPF